MIYVRPATRIHAYHRVTVLVAVVELGNDRADELIDMAIDIINVL